MPTSEDRLSCSSSRYVLPSSPANAPRVPRSERSFVADHMFHTGGGPEWLRCRVDRHHLVRPRCESAPLRYLILLRPVLFVASLFTPSASRRLPQEQGAALVGTQRGMALDPRDPRGGEGHLARAPCAHSCVRPSHHPPVFTVTSRVGLIT